MKSFTSNKLSYSPIQSAPHAVLAGNFLYLSGLTGYDESNKKMAHESVCKRLKDPYKCVKADLDMALANAEILLEEFSFSIDTVVKVTFYLERLYKDSVEEIYNEHFTANKPALTAIQSERFYNLPDCSFAVVDLIAYKE